MLTKRENSRATCRKNKGSITYTPWHICLTNTLFELLTLNYLHFSNFNFHCPQVSKCKETELESVVRGIAEEVLTAN